MDRNVHADLPFSEDAFIDADIIGAINVDMREVLYNTTEYWNSHPEIIAAKGIIYIYSDYKTIDDKIIPGIKVGDGSSYLIDMPFSDIEVELKADKATTYTKTEVNAALSSKADKANTYTKTEVNTALNDKADKINTYTKSQVDTALNLKADTSDVTASLALKADKATTYTKTEVDTALALKSDKSYVNDGFRTLNNELRNKVNKSEFLNELATKANKATTYTKEQVDNIISNLPDPMIFKGTLGVNGTISDLPVASSDNDGYTYKVITDGTYQGIAAKVGDVFTSNGVEWVLIPSGDDVEDTWRTIKVNGTEVLNSAISSGSVDFVEGDNIEIIFNSTGHTILFKTKNIYTKAEVNTALNDKADKNTTYTKSEVDTALVLKANETEVDALEYDVDKIHKAIDQYVELICDSTVEYEYGYISATTGIVGGATLRQYRTTDYIDVSGLDNITLTMPILTSSILTNAGLAFFDANKQYVSGIICNESPSAGYEVRAIDVPPTAKYIRTCFRVSDWEDFFVKHDSILLLHDNVNALENVVNKYEKFIADSSVLTKTGYISAQTGNVVSSATSYKSTDYIEVEGIESVILTFATLTNLSIHAGLAFYDKNKTFISGVECNKVVVAGYEIRTIGVPSNAKYLRTFLHNDNIENFYIKHDIMSPFFGIAEQHFREIADSSVSYENGYISAQTGVVTSSMSYRTTGYIYIKGVSNVVLLMPMLTSLVTHSGIVFFDDTYSYISGVECNYNAQGGEEIRTVKVPSDAVYMRTLCRTSKWSDFFVKTDDILSLENKIESEIQDVNIRIDNIVSSIPNGMTLFEKIGVISDSISCGWAKDKNGNNSRRNIGISWVQQMARNLGCTGYNLGASGVDPIEWFQPNYEFAEYCYTQYQSVGFCDLYIIGLGLNGGTIGTIDDINQSDYTQNASTFYGQYARIVQMINDEHPDAIVMCLTEPTKRISGYDQAVRNICALDFINAQLVDLENDYFDLFNTPEILAEHQPDGLHFTPYGYSLLADAMIKVLNDYIAKHSSAFKYVGVKEI